ncbi:hypothetical protein GJ744_008318 [Endocarpon pusillum]|uniref:Uncharacterized protein n=1 Tax=Endocarpon pusillum TaxID=364733 RepID=A0A8H7ALB0_9EURO|nr:hypothetical protein GJ744_008318 [Endocarpon pusillum]
MRKQAIRVYESGEDAPKGKPWFPISRDYFLPLGWSQLPLFLPAWALHLPSTSSDQDLVPNLTLRTTASSSTAQSRTPSSVENLSFFLPI